MGPFIVWACHRPSFLRWDTIAGGFGVDEITREQLITIITVREERFSAKNQSTMICNQQCHTNDRVSATTLSTWEPEWQNRDMIGSGIVHMGMLGTYHVVGICGRHPLWADSPSDQANYTPSQEEVNTVMTWLDVSMVRPHWVMLSGICSLTFDLR